jgi:hypothetical protein
MVVQCQCTMAKCFHSISSCRIDVREEAPSEDEEGLFRAYFEDVKEKDSFHQLKSDSEIPPDNTW